MMNRQELVQKIAKKTHYSQRQIDDILTSIFTVIEKAVAKRKKVSIASFGTFHPRKRAARTCRNPKTGEAMEMNATVKPVFVPSKWFKSLVNK